MEITLEWACTHLCSNSALAFYYRGSSLEPIFHLLFWASHTWVLYLSHFYLTLYPSSSSCVPIPDSLSSSWPLLQLLLFGVSISSLLLIHSSLLYLSFLVNWHLYRFFYLSVFYSGSTTFFYKLHGFILTIFCLLSALLSTMKSLHVYCGTFPIARVAVSPPALCVPDIAPSIFVLWTCCYNLKEPATFARDLSLVLKCDLLLRACVAIFSCFLLCGSHVWPWYSHPSQRTFCSSHLAGKKGTKFFLFCLFQNCARFPFIS